MSFKEKDIRPENLMELKKPALEHDKKYLFDRIPEFVSVDCVACGSKNHVFWAEKEGFNYNECINCGTIFMTPRADEKTIGDFYKQSKNYAFWNEFIFPTTDAVRKEKIFIPRAVKSIEYCKKYGVTGGVLVEIGSAFGTYCQAIQDQNYFQRIIAVEPTPGLAQTCRDKKIETIEKTVEELDLEEGIADVVANFEVIEHLVNPRNFIEKAIKFLRVGGLFICTCPSGTGLGTLVLKEKARVVDHEHINYFNPKSLPLLLSECGLETLEVTTPGELDVDLLFNEYNENPSDFEDNKFFKQLFENKKNACFAEFQKFLKENLLSSHMWVVARKK